MSALVKIDSDPLKGRSREAFLAELQTRLKGRVLAAYVFGSFARNDMTSASDVDLLLVVSDSELPFLKRPHEFEDLLDLAAAVDLLVYTEAEFKRLTTDPSVGFWRRFQKDSLPVLVSEARR